MDEVAATGNCDPLSENPANFQTSFYLYFCQTSFYLFMLSRVKNQWTVKVSTLSDGYFCSYSNGKKEKQNIQRLLVRKITGAGLYPSIFSRRFKHKDDA